MNQKLIFFDIDGTLVADDNHLHTDRINLSERNKILLTSTKKAIQALKDKGHIVAIATGRAPIDSLFIRKELEIDTYVSFNGQSSVVNNEIIYKKAIALDALKKLKEATQQNGHPLIFMTQEKSRCMVEERVFREYIKSYYDEARKNLWFDDGFSLEKQEIYQAQIFIPRTEEDFYTKNFDELEFKRWNSIGLDVVTKGGSKVDGIKAIADHLKIPIEDVYAFGDGTNDIEMFQFVGTSVAMGDAVDVVKKAASYVTKNFFDDGIAHAVEHLGLLK